MREETISTFTLQATRRNYEVVKLNTDSTQGTHPLVNDSSLYSNNELHT